MSENSQKKLKTYHKANYHTDKFKKQFLSVGHRGFIATCNFREKDCIRECYNILNEYANNLYGTLEAGDKPKPQADEEGGSKEIDISEDLQNNIDTLKRKKEHRFQMVETGANNCIFIKTTLENPLELGVHIVRDIAETGKRRTRHLLRLIPVEAVCKVNIKDIVDTAGSLFDRHFLKEPSTFSIIFNKRYNNDMKRDEVIKELAELVQSKNINNKVDLGNPEKSVIVEIIKGLCCLSVLPNYFTLKKYNLVELCARKEEEIEVIAKNPENENIAEKDDEEISLAVVEPSND